MLSPAESERLVRVGPGTEMGDYLRRYWHPIAAELELDEDPVKAVRLLGEDLVLFRDKSGRLGLIGRHCPHRGADLCAGMVQDDGLRCAYHGWKWASDGRCVEQPFETTVRPDGTFKDRVRAKAYVAEAKAGLVWAYLGPLPAPCLPDWARFHDVGRAQIVFTPMPCNWFQIHENGVDPVHVEWLHQQMPAHHYGLEMRGGRHVEIGFDEFEHGIIFRRRLDNTDRDHPLWTIGRVSLWPNCLYVGAFIWHVPVDDEHTIDVLWMLMGRDPAPPGGRTRVPYKYVALERTPNGRLAMIDTRHQDAVAVVGQGTFVDRTAEHLGESDRGIIMLRKRFVAELDALPSGNDPKGTIRDPEKNRRVPLPWTPLHDEQPFTVHATTLKGRVKQLLTKARARASAVAGEVERVARAQVKALRAKAKASDEPDPDRLVEGFRASALVFVMAELGLADALRDGPQSALALAHTLGAHAPTLARILDALAVHGLVVKSGDRYGESAATRRLRRGSPLHARALLVGHEFVPAWFDLAHSARTGETAFDHVFGMSNWQHRVANPPLNDAFNTHMATYARFLGQKAAAALPDARHIVDVGGGTGGFLAELLKARPNAQGTLFEQPHVIDAARHNLARLALADRATITAGDFFVSVPTHGDLYILKHVLHDWDDTRARAIVDNVVKAMATTATLWIIESPLPDEGLGTRDVHHFDIHMMAVDGGRERRLSEYRALVGDAGLTIGRVVPLVGPVRLMEVDP